MTYRSIKIQSFACLGVPLREAQILAGDAPNAQNSDRCCLSRFGNRPRPRGRARPRFSGLPYFEKRRIFPRRAPERVLNLGISINSRIPIMDLSMSNRWRDLLSPGLMDPPWRQIDRQRKCFHYLSESQLRWKSKPRIAFRAAAADRRR